MLLKGISMKGKNRVHELGAEWTLLQQVDRVLFSQECGPWGLIAPVNASSDKSRWINLRRDRDFEILTR
jgi:hypothetical protein